LGVAVDETSTLPDLSFIRLTGSGACDIQSFVDVIDLDPEPSGNWCIEALISR
jgi:hypothetical protein